MSDARSIFAVDFGTKAEGSGWVLITTSANKRQPVSPENTMVIDCGMSSNEEILLHMDTYAESTGPYELALEMLQSYGNHQGKTIHHTLLWIGRAVQRHHETFNTEPALVLRSTARTWVTDEPKANDSAVMHAVRDRFGASRKDVVGTGDRPGPLYGFKADIWQAMAVAIAFVEGCKTEKYLG